MKASLLLALMSSVGGCAATPVDPVGDWGGDHVSLNIGALESRLEFDCAYGRIDGPFVLAPDGSFTLSGMLAVEHGGPVRADEQPREHPVRYAGHVRGRMMKLKIEGALFGDYALEKGRPPRLIKCL
jgi:hypothetical protein